MPVYKLEKLMDETRRIAAEYRRSTGSTLPVSMELAKFDAIRLLGLSPAESEQRAVDAILNTPQGDRKVQIKGRVIFNPAKSGYRIGQLNLDADWDILVLVLMNDRYETTEIYQMERTLLLQEIGDQQEAGKRARGAVSVKKFKAISDLCWQAPALGQTSGPPPDELTDQVPE